MGARNRKWSDSLYASNNCQHRLQLCCPCLVLCFFSLILYGCFEVDVYGFSAWEFRCCVMFTPPLRFKESTSIVFFCLELIILTSSCAVQRIAQIIAKCYGFNASFFDKINWSIEHYWVNTVINKMFKKEFLRFGIVSSSCAQQSLSVKACLYHMWIWLSMTNGLPPIAG